MQYIIVQDDCMIAKVRLNMIHYKTNLFDSFYVMMILYGLMSHSTVSVIAK